MLTRSFQSGLVYLPTFWHGDRPVAALATLVEPRKRTFSFYMTGRDETFEGPPAGMILHAYSIRHAIERGFVEYDFLRGNEPYKYSFGCKERKIHSIVLETRSGRNLGGRIDVRCIPDVLEQATELHRKGQSADAEIGYRRILEVEPKHADALHRLGQLLAAKGDFAAAKRLFRILTTVRPDAAKAWQCLGQVCESLGQHEEALRQHLEFMRLQPDLAGRLRRGWPGAWSSSGGWRKSTPRCWPRSNRRAPRRSGSGAIGGPCRTGRPPANTRPRCRADLPELPCWQAHGREGARARCIAMNGNDRHLRSSDEAAARTTHALRLPPQTRVRMSALGAARCPNLAGREGVVVGAGRYRSTVRVMFDGFRSATSLHSTYIEPVAGEEGSSSRDRR